MNQNRPVPRLNLAPKLNRPLSLWNPLDYLRLLYWVFYFPQALRWYVDTYGGGYIPPLEMNWRKGWDLLRQNAVQRELLLQGLLLTVFTPLVLAWLRQNLGISINWGDVALAVTGGVAGGVAGSMAGGVVYGVAGSVVFGVAFGLVYEVPGGVAFGLAGGVALGAMWGVAAGGMVLFTVGGLTSLVAFGVAFAVAWLVAESLAWVVVESVALFVTWSVALGMALVVGLGVAILRPETWLMTLPFNLHSVQNASCLFPRITIIPLPYLATHIQRWLKQDWETGLDNINQLLAYSLQFIPVTQAINRFLAITPDGEIIWRVSRLAEAPFDWEVLRYASASLNAQFKFTFVEGFLNVPWLWFIPRSWRERLTAGFNTDTRLDTPARAAAAGFWYLHEQEPAKATKAFGVVRELPYGEEMYTLARTLEVFHNLPSPLPSPKERGNKNSSSLLPGGEGLGMRANHNYIQQHSSIPSPTSETLLRPTTWEALASLRRVVEDAKTVQNSKSRTSRAFALNRAIGELTEIINHRETLPQAEGGLIVDIAEKWKKALENITKEVGQTQITKPVVNPYTVGDPVEGDNFVGREDIMPQLEELWLMSNSLQSVVIYGHRRMGKTSILRNITSRIGAGVKVAYVNLLNLGNVSQEGEVLMAISDAISDVLKVPPPSDADLLQLPYRTFERYLKQVAQTFSGTSRQGLIIALDEFEKIEEMRDAGKLPVSFMGYLRGLVQMSPKIGFVLAGLHTLEEMNGDYFQPFYASFTSIKVSFMELEATEQILANPGVEDFPLDYKPEALDKIYTLTCGQPFLVQLLGFQLVRLYNDFVFEQGRPRNPVFTVEDVEAVVNNTKFFQNGRYYFDGVWGQAKRGVPRQQEIIKLLAPHPEGLSFTALLEVAGMDEASLNQVLSTLQRHDVVEERDGFWRIMVELFRRWVLRL
jgi:AAA+ ATPase superfamily predicted ATPase